MAGRFVAWLGAGILTAGMSAATLAGAGLAAAEDGAAAGGGGDTASESTSSPGTESDSKQDTDTPDPVDADDDAQNTEDGEGAEESDDDGEDADRPRNHDRSAADEKTSEDDERSAARLAADDAAEKTVDESTDLEEPSDPPGEQDPVAEAETVTVTPEVVSEAPTPSEEPVSAPDDPNVAETIATAVSSVVTTLLNPFATSTTTDMPAAQPQLWTYMAAARREFETAFESPSLEMQAAAVENSLTYTPPPAFQDQIALMVHHVFRAIRDFTGVDVYATLGALTASTAPPFFLTFGLDTERTVWTAEDGTEWQVWEFAPPNPTEKTVIAFHGGGWIYEPQILHWIDYTNMARETGATVVVPLYPLATTPEGAAKEVIPEAADFLAEQLESRGALNVSLYADSAGFTIAICAVRELLLAGEPVPSSTVLVSGAIDHSMSNPDIRDVNDPMFDIDDLDVWDSHFYDGITDRKDPLISPLFFEEEILKALPPTTIYVGDQELLYPDTLLMHERAVEVGAPISVVVGRGLVHAWPLSGLPLYTQTAVVRPDIYRQLGLADTAAV